jgi:hypothetical protein
MYLKNRSGFTIIDLILIIIGIVIAFFIIKDVAKETEEDLKRNLGYIELENEALKLKRSINRDLERVYELLEEKMVLVEMIKKKKKFKVVRLPLMIADRNKNIKDGGELLYLIKKEKAPVIILYALMEKGNLFRFKFIKRGNYFFLKEKRLIAKYILFIHYKAKKNDKVLRIKVRLGKNKIRHELKFSSLLSTMKKGVRREWDYISLQKVQ